MIVWPFIRQWASFDDTERLRGPARSSADPLSLDPQLQGAGQRPELPKACRCSPVMSVPARRSPSAQHQI